MKKLNILILGLDTFARKNIQQIVALGERGCAFDILTNDQRGDSQAVLSGIAGNNSRLFVSQGSLIDRIRLAWRAIGSGRYDLVELYPAGRMALLYLFILILKRQPFIVIERGDIGLLHEHGALTRFAIKAAYRAAAAVIYKEVYMAPLLEATTPVPLFFIPNCIDTPNEPSAAYTDRPIDFLWVNRITKQRRARWVVEAMSRAALHDRNLVVLGVESRDNLPAHLRDEQEQLLGSAGANVELHDFVDPAAFYRRAKFFCVASTVIFGNNALLEAMARGVVPIVNRSPGMELMVSDGENGIVTDFDEDAYHRGMAQAAALSVETWQRLSAAAITTVREHYSVATWAERMLEAYRAAISSTEART
jgi:glycosyltransferase involved in cell wall biosynthesis